jgi:hypothetical protein
VQAELEELAARLAHQTRGQFRWLANPSPDELRARLRLECAVFLYAGHGKLLRHGYQVELGTGAMPVDLLVADLQSSRTEVLVFDSCDSGLGHARAGLPALMRALPAANCLLGMQGPCSDIVSRAHIPALVERLLLGEPVWRAVNLLRIDLYEQGRGDWLLPVMHLKRTYRPFPVAGMKTGYLDALLDSLGESPRG